MSDETPRILVVDDDPAMTELLRLDLDGKGYATTVTTDAQDALARLETGSFDVVVTDLRMKSMHGLELCGRIVALRPDLPVIVMTAFGSLDVAIDAMRAGAHDFLNKPFETPELVLRIDRALQSRALRHEVTRLREMVRQTDDARLELGDSPAMKRVVMQLPALVESDANVLLTGESGTGKELVARYIHEHGRRKGGPFVAVNCAAMPETMLESELFGHSKGAFTDARQARKGLFREADGGTILLDEIGEMPLALQAKLLRVLQERSVRPVGADTEVKFDARIVAATNQDLESAIEEKRFREDLYYRLAVLPLALPPLRDRGGDVLRLAQGLLVRFAERASKAVLSIAPEAAERLLAYPWPGNVRELSNVIERAVALTQHEAIGVGDLPEKIQSFRRSQFVLSTDEASNVLPLAEVERRYILRVMETVAGNRTRAAQLLGLDRKTLYHKLRAYGYEEKKS